MKQRLQTHRVSPVYLMEPAEQKINFVYSHRYLQEHLLDSYELVERMEPTQRELYPSRKRESHQIDAIFTQLEDEIIAVKNDVCKRLACISHSSLLEMTSKKQKIREQIKKMNQLLSNFKEINQKFTKVDGASKSTFTKNAGQEHVEDRVYRRISEALVETSGQCHYFGSKIERQISG